MARFGVVLIGVFSILSAIVGVFLGLFLFLHSHSVLSSFRTELGLYLYMLVNPSTSYVLKLSLLYRMILETLNRISFFTFIGWSGVIMTLVSIIYFVAAIGLLAMKNWARIIIVIVGLLYILGGIAMILLGLMYPLLLIPPMFASLLILSVTFLLWGIILVVYLTGDVKYEFE